MEAQEELLQKLDKFGESFLDKYEVKKKVKATKSVSNSKPDIDRKETSQDNEDRDLTKKKRRRKKKKFKNGDAEDNKSTSIPRNTKSKFFSHTKGPNRHLEQLKQELCLDDFKEKQDKELSQLELQKKDVSGRQPEVVVFQSEKQKQKDKEKEFANQKQEKEDSAAYIDLDAARSEIQKFSIKGFKGEQKDEMMKNLLIKLGAKPPKGKYHNYKEFQEMKKKEKIEAKEQQEMDRLIGNVVKKKKGVKRKRDMNDVGHVDTQVGKYTPGVLHLKKDDIYKIQNPKKKR